MKRPGFAYQSGPVVWFCVIGGTCLALFLFQKVLWLVVPFLLALIMYYALLPLKLRLVLGGLSHDRAATLVSGTSLLLVLALLVVGIPRLAAEAVNWQASALRYLDGGMNLLVTTLTELEARVGLLAQARVSEGVTINWRISPSTSHKIICRAWLWASRPGRHPCCWLLFWLFSCLGMVGVSSVFSAGRCPTPFSSARSVCSTRSIVRPACISWG